MKQITIRVKKDTILSKKFVKKIEGNREDEYVKKKKKKKEKKHDKQKSKFKKPDKKKHKNNKKDHHKNGHKKGTKKSGSSLLSINGVSDRLVSGKHNAAVTAEIMDLLKKNMKISVKLSELFSKLFK